jgi:nicotinamidase-related amidase
MNSVGMLKRSETVLMVVDIQEKLIPVIQEKAALFANVNKLLAGMNILKVATIITEQYSKGLGHTCSEIELTDNHHIIEKICFSSLLSNDVLFKLKELNARSLILTGVEAHICVLKTALDALKHGLEVHVVADAISSRKSFDKEIAIERMRQAGAFIATTEMVLFQLMDEAGTAEFKQISKLIK